MAQQSPPSVVVLGGINMDLVTIAPMFPKAGETVVGTSFLTYPGGKGANEKGIVKVENELTIA